MTAGYVDLHCHSTASDGTLSPTDVVRLARDRQLVGLALTDHDTIGGVAEAAAEAVRVGIEFMPGIEISAEYPHPGTMHILGYGVDPDSPSLRDLTRKLLEGRDNRNPRIVQKLQELGVSITMEEVEAQAGKDKDPAAVVGRPHIAAILNHKGYVTSIKQAFDKYLAPGGLAYFDKERLTPRRAVEMIHESGGLPVLAHPVQLRTQNDAELERVVKDLADLGLSGLEIIHSDHTPELVEKYTRMADRFGLLKTGGSDFHGSNKKDIDLGTAKGRRVPRELMDKLVARHAEVRKQRVSA
jgi:predicted metal-dependent phosphoesterase TrpH